MSGAEAGSGKRVGGVGKAAPAKGTAPAKKSAPAKKAASAGKSVPAGKTATVAEAVGAEAAVGRAASAGKGTAPAGKGASGKRATSAGTAGAAGKAAPADTAARANKSAPAPTAVPAEETGARTVAAKKTANKVPGARTAAAEPGALAVRPGEEPWSPGEVAEARTELQSEVMRLRAEIQASEEAISGLMRDSGDGAGDDQADTGTKNITREHELALAANAREMLQQTERALERLDAGTYGLCENCGKPIGKARMQAFPRATLCVECKQRQERR